MELDKALSQISEIHKHVARAEVYRDFKALPVAFTGALALAAAWAQPIIIGAAADWRFIAYWMGVAVISALAAGGGILRDTLTQASPLARHRTRIVAGQLSPCAAAGLLLSVAAIAGLLPLPLLPGLWAILYSLGIFAARPYLPRMIGYNALYYLAAGGVLLGLAARGQSLNPWGMGLAFGLGQIFAGIILYWNLERGSHGEES